MQCVAASLSNMLKNVDVCSCVCFCSGEFSWKRKILFLFIASLCFVSFLRLPYYEIAESFLLKSGNTFHSEVTIIYCKNLPGTHVSAIVGMTKQPKEDWSPQSREIGRMS